MSPHEKLVKDLKDEGVIIYEPVVLRTGEMSHFYADIKRAYGNPELLEEMAQATAETIDERTTCIAASGYGGVPLAVAISLLLKKPLTLVRDTEKNHGTGGLIDGYVPNSTDFVSIVDDVFTSGSSLYLTRNNLSTTHAQIVGCHVIIARGDTTRFDMPLSYLFTAEEIMDQHD